MAVPKLVKNGVKSVFAYFCRFEKGWHCKEIKNGCEAQNCPLKSQKKKRLPRRMATH
jgi:hypothetical protein